MSGSADQQRNLQAYYARRACCEQMHYALSNGEAAWVDRPEEWEDRAVIYMTFGTDCITCCPWCGHEVDTWLNPRPPAELPTEFAFLPANLRISGWKAALDILEQNPNYDIPRFIQHVHAIMRGAGWQEDEEND